MLRFVRETALYGVGEVVGRIASVVVLARVLGPEAFGAFAAVNAFAALVQSIVVMGGDTAYARFFFEFPTLAERRGLTTRWVLTLAAVAATVAALLVAMAPAIAVHVLDRGSLSTALVVALLTTPLVVANRILGQTLRNDLRALAYAGSSSMAGIGGVAAAVMLITRFEQVVTAVFVGFAAGEVLLLFVRAMLTRDYLGSLGKSQTRRLVAFGLPLVPVSVAYWVMASGDRLVLANIASLRELGVYSVANSVTMVLMLAHAAVGQAWTPRVMALFERDRAAAARIAGDALAYLVAGVGTGAVALSGMATLLVTAVASPRYERASTAVPLLAIGLVALATTNVTALPLLLTHRTRQLAVIATLMAAANILLCAVLVPPFGFLGAAWSTVITYVMLTAAYAVAGHRHWTIRYEWRRLLIGAVATVGFACLAHESQERWGVVAGGLVTIGFLTALFAARVVDARDLASRVNSRRG